METRGTIRHRQTNTSGESPIMFHGTPDAFQRFEVFSLGIHFTSNRAVAETFAGGANGWIIAARLLTR